MNFEFTLGALAVVILIGYLGYALIRPEKF